MEQNDVNAFVDPSLEVKRLNKWRSFLTIWIHPRQTMRQIAENYPDFFTIPGIVLWVVCITDLHRSLASNTLLFSSIITLLSLCAVLFYYANIVAWIGNKLGGSAGSNLTRTSIVWAWVPYITLKLFSILVNLFIQNNTIQLFLGWSIIISMGWSLILTILFVGFVQKIPVWKAVLSLACGSVVWIIFYYLYFLVT